MLGLVDMYKNGLPPVAGGTLDQSNWFVETAQFAWSENAKIENDLKVKK